MRWLTFLLLLISSSAIAQPSREFEQARIIAEIQNRQRMNQLQWESAKKIAFVEEIPASPRPSNKCMAPESLRESTIGYLDYYQFKVLQVQGDNDMLLSLGSDVILWLEKYPTKDLVDGAQVRLVGPVEVWGTKTYKTAFGSRTVRVIRMASAEKAKAYEDGKAEAIREAAEAKEKAEAAKAEAKKLAAERAAMEAEEKKYTSWFSSDGRFSVVAKFVGFENGRVQLQKKDGTKLSIQPTQLSNQSKERYRELLKSGDF